MDRRLLAAIGTAAVVGLVGCGGHGGDGDGPPPLDAEPNYRGWFDGVPDDDGTVDRRGGLRQWRFRAL